MLSVDSKHPGLEAAGRAAAEPSCVRPSLLQEAMNMTDRVTLITGAAAGIGAELARVLAAHGHRLALVDRNAAGLSVLARDLAGRDDAPITIVCDLERSDAG